MSTFDCSKEIKDFHDEEVTLGGSEQGNMRDRRNAGRTRLENGLNYYGHPQPMMVCSQGSYSMHTMVQDDDNDYDIDDGVYFWQEDLIGGNGNALTPLQARERVCEALTRDERFAYPAKVHTNCVRQVYMAGYHIDVPVYRVIVENDGTALEKKLYELASGDNWQLSDARAVTRWFKAQVSILADNEGEDGRQMRRVVRLTKAFARSREDWKEETASGITLTRLVVDEFRSSPGRDDEALLETWKAINRRLAISNTVAHPVNAGNLAEHDDDNVAFFNRKLADALTTLEVLEEDCTREEARSAWDDAFHTNYISNLPDPGETVKAAFFVQTGSKVDARDDGNGRFG